MPGVVVKVTMSDAAMRFVPVGSAGSSPREAVGATSWTLLLPAVTIGNVGQLAVDLILSSGSVDHIGRLAAPATLPLAAPAPSLPKHETSIVTTIELYAVDTKAGTVIVAQQRAPLSPGRAAEHARELVAWAKGAGCGEVVTLASANAAGRRDQQIRSQDLPSARIRFAATQFMMTSRLGMKLVRHGWGRVDGSEDGLGWTPGQDGLDDVEKERLEGTGKMPAFLPTSRKGSFTREILEMSNEAALPLVAILMFVHEGDNSGDARVLASAACMLLDVDIDSKTTDPPGAQIGFDGYGIGGEHVNANTNRDSVESDPLYAYMNRWTVPPIWQQTVEPPRGLY